MSTHGADLSALQASNRPGREFPHADRPPNLQVKITGVRGLVKQNLLWSPDPFASITIDGVPIAVTGVYTNTLNPVWNWSFDICATPDTVLEVAVLDDRKLSEKDFTVLGLLSFRVGDEIELRGHWDGTELRDHRDVELKKHLRRPARGLTKADRGELLMINPVSAIENPFISTRTTEIEITCELADLPNPSPSQIRSTRSHDGYSVTIGTTPRLSPTNPTTPTASSDDSTRHYRPMIVNKALPRVSQNAIKRAPVTRTQNQAVHSMKDQTAHDSWPILDSRPMHRDDNQTIPQVHSWAKNAETNNKIPRGISPTLIGAQSSHTDGQAEDDRTPEEVQRNSLPPDDPAQDYENREDSSPGDNEVYIPGYLLRRTCQTIASLAAEHGISDVHQKYAEDNPPQFNQLRPLGHGSLGSVDEVQVPNFKNTLARKSVMLTGATRNFCMEMVEQEVKALRSLSNCHIVQVLGTYEFGPCYAVLMSPVGDRNLKDMLEEFYDRNNKEEEREWIKKWFFCLTSALQYIHSKGIRHEDIKPSNIIHRSREVYLTDFSSYTEFEMGMTTSTDTPAGRVTRIYTAPEALEDERHGLSADIFSMGCVFVEMATVVGGKRVSELYEHCSVKKRGSSKKERLYYSQALERLDKWFNGEWVGIYSDGLYDLCIKPMMAEDRKQRPKAGHVMDLLEHALGLSGCLCEKDNFSLVPTPWNYRDNLACRLMLRAAPVPITMARLEAGKRQRKSQTKS